MEDLRENILKHAIAAHRIFATTIWPKNPLALKIIDHGKILVPSYHSHHHIFGVVGAATAIELAFKNNDDPFELNRQLKIWNTKNKAKLSIRQFFSCLIIALACHDLGNITRDDTLTHEDAPFHFADTFRIEVGESESRSATLTIHLIELLDEKHTTTGAEKKLVTHLIMQSIFKPEVISNPAPFWLLIQVIDQIGTHYFANKPIYETVGGYLNELYALGSYQPRAVPPLKTFLNFLPHRFRDLVPDRNMRKMILLIFDPEKKYSWYLSEIEAPEVPIDYKQDIVKLYRGDYHQKSSTAY